MSRTLVRVASFALVTAISLALSPVSWGADPACSETYEIKNGDTFASVARTRATSLHTKKPLYGNDGIVAKAVKLNHATVPSPGEMEIGTKVLLPSEISVCPERKTASTEPSPDTPPSAAMLEAQAKAYAAAHPPAPFTPVPAAIASLAPRQLPPPDEPYEFPERFEFLVGGSALLANTASAVPSGAVDAGLHLGSIFWLRGGFDGFIDPANKLVESQSTLALEAEFFHVVTLGVGYRYFTFGADSPAGPISLSNHGPIARLGIAFEPFKRIRIAVGADARVPIGMLGAPAGDTLAVSPQFGGFIIRGSVDLLLSRHILIGPYYYYDSQQLSYSDTAASLSGTFAATEYGAGLRLGFGF